MNTSTITPAVARVQGLALVRVTGADAVDFLHGQFTQKIRGLEGAVRACGYCSPKGRLLAVFRAFPMTDGAVGLLVPASIVEGFVKRLRMYVLRSKVTFEVAAASIAVATGEAGAAALAAAGLEAPQTGRTTRAGDAYLLGLTPAAAVEGFAAAGARTLLVSESTLADKLPVVEETDDRTWRASEMAAGMPVVLAETLERFTPQAANLELAGGVVFDKGCYPGQEVVSRLQHLGETKRRGALALFDAAAPKAGDAVYFEGSETGAVIDAVSLDGRTLVFASVALEAAAAGFALAPESTAGTPAALPYVYRNVLKD